MSDWDSLDRTAGSSTRWDKFDYYSNAMSLQPIGLRALLVLDGRLSLVPLRLDHGDQF